MNDKSQEIVQLRALMEQSAGRTMHTPADFSFLSGVVWERLHEYISPTTLKRIWGYIDGVKQIRYSTLDIMARFSGFDSWDFYLGKLKTEIDPPSGMIDKENISSQQLSVGDRVQICWNPDRRCIFKYMGECQYQVIEAEKTHLKAGDTCTISIFVLGEPLIISNLTHMNRRGLNYLCGGRDGLTSISIL